MLVCSLESNACTVRLFIKTLRHLTHWLLNPCYLIRTLSTRFAVLRRIRIRFDLPNDPCWISCDHVIRRYVLSSNIIK